MTTLQMQDSSQPYSFAPEDPMEVMSDTHRDTEIDQDIDIDLDLTGDVQADEEDDDMIEDSTSLNGLDLTAEQDIHTGKDDEMIDGGFVQESMPERLSDFNEEIEDADHIQTDVYEDPNVEDVTATPRELSATSFAHEEQIRASRAESQDSIERAQQQNERHSQYVHVDDPVGEGNVEKNQSLTAEQNDLCRNRSEEGVKPPHSVAGDDDAAEVTSQMTPVTAHEEVQEDDKTPKLGQTEANNAAEADDTHSVNETTSEHEPNKPTGEQLIEQNTENPTIQHGVISKESTHIHPIMVMYQDNEISLFPLIDLEEEHESTYFLQDERLASDNISNLLGACRSVLGESVDVQDELMIDIEELGLHITEFAPESSTITLVEVVDIYVQLQHYDGLDDPPALYIQLTTKPRFSPRFEYLMNAVAEQKGLSQTQPSNENEEDVEQFASESPHSSHRVYDIDDAPSQEHQTPHSPPDDRREGSPKGDQIENTGDIAIGPSGTSNATTQAVMTDPGSVSQGHRNNDVDVKTSELRNISSTVEPDNYSESLLEIQPIRISSQPQPTASVPQAYNNHTTNDGASADHMYSSEHAHDRSSESSTMQGDSIDLPTDASLDALEHEVPLDEIKDQQDSIRVEVEDSVLQENLSSEDKKSPATSPTMRVSDDIVKNDSDNVAPTEEQNAAEPERLSDVNEDLHEFDHKDEPYEGDVETDHHTRNTAEAISQEENDKITPLYEGTQHNPASHVVTNGRLSENVPLDQIIAEDAEQSNAQELDFDTNKSSQHEYQTDYHYDEEISKPRQAEVSSVHGRYPTPPFQQGESKPPDSVNVVNQVHDDDDEITYDDDENEVDDVYVPSGAGEKAPSSPGLLKRARSSEGDDWSLKTEEQGAKRVRSG